jgi:ubiquinone/menaquinone biosynthesis C-methylase UbiE
VDPSDKTFAGSIPELYEQFLVPLIFEPYAVDIARRVAGRAPASVLEVAAGTGVVTRQLAMALPAATAIVATDLNQPMLDQAAAVGTRRAVEWQRADAMQLPFADDSFDVVVCQFGAMFFPDKAAAFAEARRVLRAGGAFVFNVWDRIEVNELADVVTRSLESLHAADPPRFLARTPHGYHDQEAIARDLEGGGFERIEFTTLTQRSRAPSPRQPAVAFCQGTPLRNEIEARNPGGLEAATRVAEAAVARRFGGGAIDASMQAHIVVAEK